jgi:hypothetical protein
VRGIDTEEDERKKIQKMMVRKKCIKDEGEKILN